MVTITTLALTGCGGGGGGGPMTGMPPTQQPPAQQPPAQQPGSGTTPSGSGVGDLNPTTDMVVDNILTAIGRAAGATPRAGSVTQSSNVNNQGITTDQVDVTAEYGATVPGFAIRNGTTWSIGMGEGNPRPIAGVTPPFKGTELTKRVSGGTVYVEAYTDIEAPQTSAGSRTYNFTFPGINVGGRFTQTNSNTSLPAILNGVNGRASCTGCSFVYTTGQLEMTGGSMTFTPGDGSSPTTLTPGGTTQTILDTDYLSGGVWLFVPTNAASADDYVFGAFADGSDPFAQSALPALTGTARYDGAATGIYSAKLNAGTEIGYFEADAALTANFGDRSGLGTISGSLTNFKVDGEPDAGTLIFGTANIGSSNSGSFRGSVTDDGAIDSRSWTGQWGGQFFGNGESDGRPGSVAGTFGAHSTDFSDIGGGEASIVGAFGAYKQ